MRKLLLASAAVFALSSAAHAANTSTTFQVGGVNVSTVNQQGHVNDSSLTTQIGFVNSASTMQGTTSISLNNAQGTLQIGAVNSATAGQAALGNNLSGIGQFSIGNPPANSTSVGQFSAFGGLNLSLVTQQ